MKEIFEQYGGVIVSVIAIVALIGIVSSFVGSSGLIQAKFVEMVNDLTSYIP